MMFKVLNESLAWFKYSKLLNYLNLLTNVFCLALFCFFSKVSVAKPSKGFAENFPYYATRQKTKTQKTIERDTKPFSLSKLRINSNQLKTRVLEL